MNVQLPFDELEKGESATLVSNGHELLVVPNDDLRKIDAIAAEMKVDEFDWRDDDSIVLRHQLAIAIYRNNAGGITIRQEADWNDDEDIVIYVDRDNIAAFIDKLCDVAGIPSAGKP